MKYTASNTPIQCMMTHSTWYQDAERDSIPVGVLWHDTNASNPYVKRYVQPYETDTDYDRMIKLLGKNTNGNDWNHSARNAGLNAFVGKLADDTVASVQAGPWTMAPWGCGLGPRGSCNGILVKQSGMWTHRHWIQFEICDDGYQSKEYFEAVYEEACQLTAYLCWLYDLNPRGVVKVGTADIPVILCHQDSYRYQMGNDHSDVLVWFKKFDKTMQDVRNRVHAILAGLDLEDPAFTVRDKFAQIAIAQPTSSIGTSSTSFIQECSSQLDIPAVSTSAAVNCTAMITQSVDERLGVILSDSARAVLQEGDVLCICNSPQSSIKSIDYLSVVTTVMNGQVSAVSGTIQLSNDSKYQKQTQIFAIDDPRILYVYRPRFQDDLESLQMDPTEASLRTFASLDSQNEPSINTSSNIGLALINYQAASNFVQIISGAEPEVVKQRIIEVMMSVPRTIVEYLQQHNFTIAASVAICANMYCDSRWDATFTQRNALGVPVVFGLCRWSGDRAKLLQTYADWHTSLSVQLDFLIRELRTYAQFSNLFNVAKSTVLPIWFTEKFYSTYYDVVPTDRDIRKRVAELLWEMTEEVMQ